MAANSTDTMLSDVAKEYENAKTLTQQAIDKMNTRIETPPQVEEETYDVTWQNTLYVPVSQANAVNAISSVDDMIATVMTLSDQIGNIKFTPPDAIPNMQMEDHKIWKDAFADKIETSLSAYVTSMGMPNKSYQDSIFNESYERNLQSLNDLLEIADAKTGARGFTYPNSMTTVLKLDAQQKHQFDRTQVGRDITKLVTEWARQNYQFAIEKGISFEQFHADFTYKYCTAFVDIYKNLVNAAIERFKAEIIQFVEPIRGLVEAAKLPFDVSRQNAEIEKWNADFKTSDNARQIDEALKIFDINTRKVLQNFETQVSALDSIAKQQATLVQSSSRSVLGVKKLS